VASIAETENAYKVLVAKSDGKRLLGRPRLGGKNNIKSDFKEL
jgi:hypothetical protein